MAWWQGYWGWFVTTALAGVSAVGVLVELVVLSKRRPRLNFNTQHVGTLRIDSESYELLALENTGTVRASGVTVLVRGATQQFPDELTYVLPKSFDPGVPHCMALTGMDGDSYLVIAAVSSATRKAVVTWAPAMLMGAAADRYLEQAAKERRWGWLPWRRFGIGPVGPTGRMIVRVTQRRARDQKTVQTAMSEPPK